MLKKLALLLLLAVPVLADEGMWMPQQMPHLADSLQKLGFKIDPARFSDLTGDPLGAVVLIPGCTASFVSPDGLIVTNHHCAFGSIQHNSTPQRDLITNGFLAKTREEELPAAPGTKVWVTTNIEDVTKRMTENIDARTPDAGRARTLDRREKELVAECEKPGGLRCSVSSFFEGSQYLRTTRMELTDVRLVYAPAEAIGNFGGDIDNFEWPRHVGDFSFYRAYQNGKPYKPAHWLKLATSGVNEGDPVMVIGYPGRTFRYKTADEVRNYQEFVYPVNIRYFSEALKMMEDAGKNDKDAKIKNASRIESFANSLKNYQSVSEGFAKDHIFEARVAREEQMNTTMRSRNTTLDDIAAANHEKLRTRERDLILDWLPRAQMVGQAFNIARVATERPKKDIDRLARYQEREWPSLLQSSVRAQRTLELHSDRAILGTFLNEAAKLPADQRIKPIDDAVAAAASVNALLDRLYGSTKVASQEERAKMLNESTAQLRARNDAMVDFALSLLPLLNAREERDMAWSGAMIRLRPRYFELLRNMSGNAPIYPDANSTLRITFGRIAGYRPKDATWYTPQTTLRGVVEKEKGEEPFASPKTLLDAAKDPNSMVGHQDPDLKDVPVNFLSTCDTTGGNSGSPTLNANGELVGLLFDGNYESIDADFLFHEADTRSIHVDTQYMLWIMDAVDHADHLMKELGVR
ncbi:MAG: S46 family peptidase [Acidobacteria bacterium]|nr:MAG: S46 family peptidase [Acidobacteriota bacterium]